MQSDVSRSCMHLSHDLSRLDFSKKLAFGVLQDHACCPVVEQRKLHAVQALEKHCCVLSYIVFGIRQSRSAISFCVPTSCCEMLCNNRRFPNTGVLGRGQAGLDGQDQGQE